MSYTNWVSLIVGLVALGGVIFGAFYKTWQDKKNIKINAESRSFSNGSTKEIKNILKKDLNYNFKSALLQCAFIFYVYFVVVVHCEVI